MSNIHEMIESMLEYKESLGYSRRSYEYFLLDAERYLINISNDPEFLLINTLQPWCVQRQTEKANSYRRRLTALREFTKYLFATGQCDAVLSTDSFPILRSPDPPYLFTDDELCKIFRVCDQIQGVSKNPLASAIIATIYRMIFFCGLRPSEGREMYRADVDVGTKVVLVRKNKTHKERRIPISEELAHRLAEYIDKRDLIAGSSPYLFPSRGGIPYSPKWLSRNFNSVWRLACPEKKDLPVHVYNLRHRYATTVMMQLIDSGENLYSVLPYLSSYMGHSSFRETAYYIHLLPERLVKSASIDWDSLSDLIPEVQ